MVSQPAAASVTRTAAKLQDRHESGAAEHEQDQSCGLLNVTGRQKFQEGTGENRSGQCVEKARKPGETNLISHEGIWP